jgi:hypothetical protein
MTTNNKERAALDTPWATTEPDENGENPLSRDTFYLFAKTMRAKRGLLEDGGAELRE